MFGAVLITICTLMHLYVAWRATTIPAVRRHLPGGLIPGFFLLLWLVFFSGRTLGHHGTGPVATALEFAGMNWMAALFLIFISLLIVDILTLWGFLLQRTAPTARPSCFPTRPGMRTRLRIPGWACCSAAILTAARSGPSTIWCACVTPCWKGNMR